MAVVPEGSLWRLELIGTYFVNFLPAFNPIVGLLVHQRTLLRARILRPREVNGVFDVRECQEGIGLWQGWLGLPGCVDEVF
jgi:hypothetical protein